MQNPPASTRQSLMIGLVWMTLTVALEFIFGRLVMCRHWSRHLSEYNMLKDGCKRYYLFDLRSRLVVFFRVHCGQCQLAVVLPLLGKKSRYVSIYLLKSSGLWWFFNLLSSSPNLFYSAGLLCPTYLIQDEKGGGS